MLKFLKAALGGKTVPAPDVELIGMFTKLQTAQPVVLKAIQYRVNHLYELLEIDDRQTEFVSDKLNGNVDVNAHTEFLARLFKMEGEFFQKGMNEESVAAKLLALDYACLTVKTSSLVDDCKRARTIFSEFRSTGEIELNPRGLRFHPK